ncbi:MAG: hypothetical protein A3G22_06460 [Alphaproteobacteria bacterium RIFCSPLOWO2_12_FULL_40_11]|nr:MAG: hypothetical protein A2794_04180 [Alphaproteobacteria bacterium RIFCSPHIGHO2_01_FULL_40_8]OFX10237.1 MAG: hypothetical protein A3H30_05300 [Alphaproteobacteria bacterium RIFCSPLOWO2_02_FULL_40_19]OFX11821.1 MAG: hypothetical protein A3G22_06460 [Alphaproteobacteria bacterium RIFCSPLOWO2_12_FULL_40_11]
MKPRKWGILLLFTSAATLICCAIPILLVTLGMGAVVASLAFNVPFLITLSQHKGWMFIGTAIILLLAGWVLYRPGRTCPTDPELAKLCAKANKWNVIFYWGSVIIWMIGFITAYLLPFLSY